MSEGTATRRKVASHLRLALRIGLAAAVTALLIAVSPSKTQWVTLTLSPHVSVCSAITLRTISMATFYCLPIVIGAAFIRRVFCRFMCPVGLMTELCGKARPGPKPKIGKLPPIGQWLALASIGAAVFGCPLFLWLDPLGFFGGAISVIGVPVTIVSLIPAALLFAVLLVSFLVPNLWCGRLCPLGGTQDILADLGGLAKRAKAGMPPSTKKTISLARRTALCAGAGAAWALAVQKLFASGKAPLRPPGARGEMTFKSLCIRCGACVRACPTQIIKRDLTGEGSSILSPVVRYPSELYAKGYCREDCHSCGKACPTGAIQRLAKGKKNAHTIGLVRVEREKCYLSIPEECGFCVSKCPFLALNSEFSYEHGSMIVVDQHACTGCGKCLTVCPAQCLMVEAV